MPMEADCDRPCTVPTVRGERMRPLYIFDLDGTLALIEHRLFHIRRTPQNWKMFFEECIYDEPNWPVLRIAREMREGGYDIWVWSGRDDIVMEQTREWLDDIAMLNDVPLRMRQHGDDQPDVSLKRGWLHAMDPADRARLQAVFDDRSSVVTMWREEGVPCFQVAEGEF